MFKPTEGWLLSNWFTKEESFSENCFTKVISLINITYTYKNRLCFIITREDEVSWWLIWWDEFDPIFIKLNINSDVEVNTIIYYCLPLIK